ncbi:uncharacterized protein BDR25DRAFT_306838 [Lindgomyces ingoldianus]|uniref:Uncharacterized protein n=1 Tax=Lindgomyces ingoldianus TaxID=673940 RepID=A0ACB6QGE0_9PLEO|nr:uncharacterized protein BDR25DRAFT_306838 [Lindgomyces ingoldianus]KAF2465201.1 hypothetical protein BDR25DRAFT_306838 [Lindgomyces ingoldianus]
MHSLPLLYSFVVLFCHLFSLSLKSWRLSASRPFWWTHLVTWARQPRDGSMQRYFAIASQRRVLSVEALIV